MATRTTRETVTFMKPFILGDFDEVLAPGSYVVDTDEDLLQGLSFDAYVRVLTIIQLPDKSGNTLLSRALTIDPHELDAALMRDRESSEQLALDGPSCERKTQLTGTQPSSAVGLAMKAAVGNEGLMADAQ